MTQELETLNARSVLSEKKKEKFLELLAQTGRITEAAKAVGYLDTTYLHKLRRKDEEFAKAWDLAIQAAADALEDEVMRRAQDGVAKPVFYKGEIVGYEQVYSDQLAMFMLRGMRPEKFNQKGSGTTTVDVKFGIAVLPMTSPSIEAWEKNAIEVHANQRVIELEAKPDPQNGMQTIKRGD